MSAHTPYASPITAVGPRRIPVDIDAALVSPEWRNHVAWPVTLVEANRIGSEQVSRTLAFVLELEHGLARDGALLALPIILGYARAIVLTALVVKRAGERGEAVEGRSSEFHYLVTGEGKVPSRSDPILPPQQLRFEFLRRVARVHSWSGILGLPFALYAPDAVSIGHNTLLRRDAARSQRALDFCRAERLLSYARRTPATVPVPQLPEGLIDALVADSDIDEPLRSRTTALIRATCAAQFDKAVRDMAVLRTARLPGEVWAGSGGLYASRAVGIEVLRRGGRVRRFDHGKPRGFIDRFEVDTLLEYSVSSEFVVPTEGIADLARKYSLRNSSSGVSSTEIVGLDGDPTFARVPVLAVPRRRPARPRVIYAPTQLLGFRTLLPMQQPDVVHLDWQMRICEALRRLPIEFVCQAHPEGYFKNRPHPLEAVAATVRGNFEAELGRADVFVFDCPSTTALWEASCTNARIVYVDIGGGVMTPPVANLFADRAMLIEAAYDDDNRPILDHEALAEAVLSGEPADPMPLRRLLAGLAA